jgi:hypothetical protein
MPRESAAHLKLWKSGNPSQPVEPQTYKSSPISIISSNITGGSYTSDANEPDYTETGDSAGGTRPSSATKSLRDLLKAKELDPESRDLENSENSSSIEATAISTGLPPRGSQNEGADSSSILSDRSVRTVITYRPSSSSAEVHGEDGDGEHIISRPRSSASSAETLPDPDNSVMISEGGILRIASTLPNGEPLHDLEWSAEQFERLKNDLMKKTAMQNLPLDWWKSKETFELGSVPPPAMPPKDGKRHASEGYITFYWLNRSPWPPGISKPYSVMVYLDPKHFRCDEQIEIATKSGIPVECCLSFGGYAGDTTGQLLEDLHKVWEAGWNEWQLDHTSRESLWSAFRAHWKNLERIMSRKGGE